MKIITRKEAKEQGLKFYFTGKSCCRGHVCERRIINWRCIECEKKRDKNRNPRNTESDKKRRKEYYENNKEYLLEQKRKYNKTHKKQISILKKKYREANKEQLTKKDKEYYEANKEKKVEYNKGYYKANKGQITKNNKKYHEANKDEISKQKKEYYQANKEYFFTHNAKRRAAKKQAIPSWYKSEKEFVEFIYKCSQERSKSSNIIYHVDHIVPLQNDLVCGLHCIANLQILTESENSSKNNKFNIEKQY